MRFKIGFEFPYFKQKKVLHSHSHFAFPGWITHTLMTLLVFYLQSKTADVQIHKYRKILLANLICSYGMLIFFIIQGYRMISIFFATVSILVSYVFGCFYI